MSEVGGVAFYKPLRSLRPSPPHLVRGETLCLEGRHLRTHLYRHGYKHEQVQEDGLLTPAKPRRRLETSSLGKQPSHDSACAATTEQRPSRRGCSEPLLVLEAAA